MRRSLAKESRTSRPRRAESGQGLCLSSWPATPLFLACALALAIGSALLPAPGDVRAQATAPSIDEDEVGVREVTDNGAILAGYVTPNGSHTTYRFDYGTDTGYGSTTAVDSAGSGAGRAPVSKAVTGLLPNTTYHFRLVAANAGGETVGADHIFTTDADPPQPSGRAYEMVSPLDKNGGDIDRDLLELLRSQTGAAPSGEAVAFTSRVAFGNIESGTLFPNYVARRGPGGWTTEGISPPISNLPTGSDRPWVLGLSFDLSKAYVRTGVQLTPDASRLNGSWGLYARNIGQADRYTLVSSPSPALFEPPNTPPNQDGVGVGQTRFTYIAATSDSRHVVFNSSRRLLPGQDVPSDGADNNAVYEWLDGTLRLASVMPDGLTAASVAAGRRLGPGNGLQAGLAGDHVISDDGGRVFFTAQSPPGGVGTQLFVRENGVSTRPVSASELSGDQYIATADPDFYAAKRTDGSVAIFQANAALTQGAGQGSLYRWDANAPEGQRLVAFSQAVRGPAAISDDAASVYFVAGNNLQLWREGEGVRQIATLDTVDPPGTLPPADHMMWGLTFGDGGRAARVSADGERLLFASYAQLDDDYDTTEATPEACGSVTTAGDRCRQIYLYDARSGETSCLTCVAGALVTGDANLFGNGDQRRPAQNNRGTITAPVRLPRNLSADGRRAYFETGRQLVSADRNSVLDVYEWVDADLDGQGKLRLVSTGRGSTDSKFLDASASGDDVFFTTRERLVGIDTDNQADVYDARVGGGIPAQNPPPASPCAGEDCQGALSGAPFVAPLGSGGMGLGDLRPRPRPSFSVARLSRSELERLARGRRVVIRVRVNRAGRVRLSARAKIGRRMRTIASASKVAHRAGRVGLGVKLSSGARRELARRGSLNVRLAVRFAGVREARTSTVRLRKTSSSGERGTR